MIAGYNLRPTRVSCSHCGAEHVIMINPEDIIRWQSGEYIQDCMAYLSKADRELLISQTCNDCWINMFGEDEDEDEV